MAPKDVLLPDNLNKIPKICGTCRTFFLKERIHTPPPYGMRRGLCLKEAFIDETFENWTPEEAHGLSEFESARKEAEEMAKTGITCGLLLMKLLLEDLRLMKMVV